MLKAGELVNRITIQQNTPSTNADGTKIENWIDVITVWAAYEAKSGRELFAALRFNSEVNAIFRIRYQPDINVEMRVIFWGRQFDILFINDSGKYSGEMILACREVV